MDERTVALFANVHNEGFLNIMLENYNDFCYPKIWDSRFFCISLQCKVGNPTSV